MGDDSLILREDGYIRMNFPVTSLTYHSNLNIILVKTDAGGIHVLDVNSGVILQSSCLSADERGTCGVEYAPGADRVFVWDAGGVGARTDYNGVLLLHTALQRPLASAVHDCPIRLELVLSEAVLLYQCLQGLEFRPSANLERLPDFLKDLENAIDSEPSRKGVKAQKWSTVTLCMPQRTMRLTAAAVVQELKTQGRHTPALAIASAVSHRSNELVPVSRDEESRPLMYSEAERKETFKRWPHMDYKWALPARMAQAGFYHQPTPSGDDRAMCFSCLVCLVCWEKSDEPWVEHERHSPNCSFVRGEYTHNVPISVTNATACAVSCPNVRVVSKGNTGDFIATGTEDGKVNVWKFDCGLKLVKYIQLSPYDSIFSGILATDTIKVWAASLEKDSSTYSIELTAMAFIGMTPQQETVPQTQNAESTEKENATVKPKPALICAVVVTRTNDAYSDQPIEEDSSKALFDLVGSNKPTESIQEMNDQNEAKSNQSSKMLFLLTYDIHSSQGGSINTAVQTSNSGGNAKAGGSKKVCAVARTDDANIYDDIYFQYSDEDTELPPSANVLIDEQISNVINLNASSSKDDSKIWEPAKKIILTKHFKVVPPPGAQPLLVSEFQEQAGGTQASMLDFVGQISQLKSWKSGTLDSAGTKLADQTDAAAVLHADPHLHHYLNMSSPIEITDMKWYDGGEGTEKVKVTAFSGSKLAPPTADDGPADGFDAEPPQDEASQAVAVQCLALPAKLALPHYARVTHVLPTEDKEHLLVIVSTIDPEMVKADDDSDNEGDHRMDVDDAYDGDGPSSDSKAYFILYEIYSKTSIYTLEDNPVSIKELPYEESPVDLCLLPGADDRYSFASVGLDGALRVYSLPDFRVLSEQRVSKGCFTSVTYCASVDRLCVSTKQGMIYFYALNDGEKDTAGDMDEDEFANLDFEMLQRAPRDDTAPVILAHKPELGPADLETLLQLTGAHGTNTPIPYSAVVPGFWCELSPAQRPRSDHQNNRTWRLQNTSSTWDEHVLELTLPYSVSLAHIEFSFTLHAPCASGLPVIMVTLLKQNLHGIGYKKDATFGHRCESPISFPVMDTDMTNLENPIYSEEYLQAHNAEILAGPLLLSSGLDATQQAGTLTLTSPRLYRARGRTFLIHIKTLYDPAKDMSRNVGKSEDSKSASKKFIGCDWLHQISLTVRSSPHTAVPMERQQRIAMLESNPFLNTLCEIAVSRDDLKKRMLALDIMIWVVSVRLQRMRLAKSEKGKVENKSVETQQLECIKVIEKHIDALILTCILCGDRSIANKCIRLILITTEGESQLPKPWKSTFSATLAHGVASVVPYCGGVKSGGALRWLAALVQQATPPRAAPDMVARLLDLLQRTAAPLLQRQTQYHHLLRSRFGLYGLPFERTIFAPETPDVGRNGAPVTYANMVAGESSAPAAQLRHDQQLRELLNWPKETQATTDPKSPWWVSLGAGVFSLGLSEATPLHVSCHVASEGTKLEAAGARVHAAAVTAMPGAGADPQQLWSAVKEGQPKQPSQEPDSSEDVESTMMDCDAQEKLDFSEEKLFKEAEQCDIPWAALVTRPPQHTLLVERMHSGARRYIVLDFGHVVRLTDVIIPSCSDLVTLCIDIWVTSEETDCVKLAFATDIANRNLVLTDLQPPPLCRYMKITTIGRYGMSAMKCKIPLGWFYGEIAEIANVQASINALNALHQDLSCRFRLATGKLTELLNPYIGLYNGNACHMMAYLNNSTEGDQRVTAAYNECIELQQQLHTCTLILRRLQNLPDEGRIVADKIANKEVSPESLLETASTDKLRVIMENVVDMLLYFYFQVPDVQYPELSEEWCRSVLPLVWECGGLAAGALATLLARACGAASWWGGALAGAITTAFAASLAPPTPLDRCLVLVIYMCRKSMFSHTEPEGGVAQALCARALELVRAPRPQPALTAAVLTALAAVLDAVAATATTNRHSRWDWVSGGWAGSAPSSTAASPRGDCKLHRRKLHKKLLTQMQELEAARRGIHDQLEDQQRARVNLKARMAMLGKRSSKSSEGTGPPRPVSAPLASALASALVQHMLAADSASDVDALMLCAKVVGRLCALCGGGHLLEPTCILGLARLTVTLPPWPKHALTTLLQDLVEFENTETTSPTGDESWSGAGASRVIRVTPERATRPFQPKPPRKQKGPTVADLLADSFGLPKSTDSNGSKPKFNSPPSAMSPNAVPKDLEAEEQLTQVAESDDSEFSDESLEPKFMELLKKETKKVTVDTNTNAVSRCGDARLEGAGGGAGEAAARRALLATGAALAAAVRAPPLPPAAPTRARAPDPPLPRHPPLTHTLYDVFRHLALDFHKQMDCSFMENVVALWLTLNGSAWGACGAWALAAALALPADTPRIRLASDTVTALLHALCTYESVSLRCWVLSMQTLAWIASLPLQTEGSTRTMSRVIIECEHFVPALVKFINMDVNTEGVVMPCEPYLSGCCVGAGAGACAALQSVVSRVACARGAAGALSVLRVLAGAWQRPGHRAYDLHAALLRLAHPLLQVLQPKHTHHALPLLQAIAEQSGAWVREVGCGAGCGAGGERGTLADMVAGGRRAPCRRSVLAQLLAYARKLLHAPLPATVQPSETSSSSSPSAEQSLTDESKAQHSGVDSTNMEDEKKQQAARTPCLADAVIQHPDIMHQFFKTLMLCDDLNMHVLNSGSTGSESNASIKEEVFWLVSHIATVAASPANMVPSLLDFLRRSEVVNLSQAMQQLIVRVLENPEALAAFIDQGGLELALEKLTAKHQSGPSHKQGLVSSLMNYLKLPPQLINMSSSPNKKPQPLVADSVSSLINIAPLCSITCGNPTAQAADVLLEGGAGTTGARGACAARRVRAATWSYHFFSADDTSLALTITLPYAARLHEVQLQPHLTSLATCPGAVAVEAGCAGTLAPLGPPQNTAGMTFIRLVVARPVVCTTLQLRLYKPRDSSNMGLLQLRLLVAPAFTAPAPHDSPLNTNKWASVIACCTRGGARLSGARWGALGAAGAVSALCACVAAGGGAAHAAQRVLRAAAAALPRLREPLLHALLDMDTHAYAHAFQASAGRAHSGVGMICALIRALCRACPEVTVRAYVQWLRAAPARPDPPAPPTLHTLAEVLWMLKEQQLMENVEEIVTDDLFDTVFNWVRAVPETSLLKSGLDAILCSMCYIRPELFKTLLQRLKIPVDVDESMECLTDDTKVQGSPRRVSAGGGDAARRLAGGEARTVAVAAMSPAATLMLLNSALPSSVVTALTEFAEERLAILKEEVGAVADAKSSSESPMTDKSPSERADVACMVRARQLVEWVRLVSADRRARDWAGSAGAAFWRPLLALLCYPRRNETTWQASSQFAELEESTIKMFAELTSCHPHNQKLFATTLHGILESMPEHESEGISGFTRALILRLMLSLERVQVALAWAGGAGLEAAGGAGAPHHPALPAHTVRALPLVTTVRDLLADHRPPLPIMDETSKLSISNPSSSAAGSVLRSASDTAISTVTEAWELSLAAASASKDKRVKDVKNTSLKNQNTKKRQTKNDISVVSVIDDVIETTIRVQVAGLEGYVSGSTTLAQLCAAVPHTFGPHLTLTLHLNTNGGEWSSSGRTVTLPIGVGYEEGDGGVLREFGACGGLALVAGRLPRPHAPPPPPPAKPAPAHDLDWVKLDDPYEEAVELGGGTGGGGEAACGVPAHALAALGLLLKLPGYAHSLLDEGARALHLLRLLMGVAHTEDGRSISMGCSVRGFSLGTLPFRVVTRLLELTPRRLQAGGELRARLLRCGAVRMLLACLAVFTHHKPANTEQNSQSSTGARDADKGQLYWAKGTGFGTGSTQQSWNVEQALVRQRTEEEHVTVLLQVLASYMNPGEAWPPDEIMLEEAPPPPSEDDEPDYTTPLPDEFIELIANSSLVPAICSYLRNDSVLDMSRHIPLYVCVLRCARALHSLQSERLAPALAPIPRLLHQMSRTTNSYATKLRMSKKNIFGKMTYSQRFISAPNSSELSEEDEGLAALIADIQATSALMCRAETELESSVPSALSVVTREQRYIELMRTMQFETFEMITECGEYGFRFTVPYHFEGTVRAAGERSAPARMKRLAQEAATLATSLPLSYSSSVFVRTDTDRLDVMKVLITGPSDTPYANGCFILDVYFPAEYPAVPMLINLETTGRHSVRFNPNLYNDGKVCLSVLNTWHGRPEEKWNAHTSSFLQVLVSIQSLILVPEPYFNEPGYERSRGTRVGAAASTEYNSNIYQACVRWAMLDQLRNPEPCFKEVIQTHFWMKRNEIMQTVAGWITELEAHHGDERTQRSVHHNAMALKRHYVKLQEELAKLECPPGLEELDEPFQLPPAPAPAAPAPATTPAPAPATTPTPATAPAPAATSPATADIDHDMEKIVSQVLD